jgi:hypothetical protein
MASFAVDRELSLEAYNHDLKARFFRHKQRGNGGRIDDDARRRYLRKAMCRYYHNAMTKPNGLQWLERPEWRYMSESDGDGDDDDNGDDVDTTPTTTTTWQCVGSGLQWLEGQEWRYVSESGRWRWGGRWGRRGRWRRRDADADADADVAVRRETT